MSDRYVETNGIRLHYLEHSGPGPTLVLAPGLTANAHSFDGLIAAGLPGRPPSSLSTCAVAARATSPTPATRWRTMRRTSSASSTRSGSSGSSWAATRSAVS